ncbi:hypothetical protein CBL_07420 [Carabus blaptoides fortunei]
MYLPVSQTYHFCQSRIDSCKVKLLIQYERAFANISSDSRGPEDEYEAFVQYSSEKCCEE